jgi:hypothetical protein
MHDTAKRNAIQGLSLQRSVRAVVFDDYGNVLSLEQTLEDMKGMVLVCGIPHERFSELYWKLRSPYDRGDIDGPANWTAVVSQQELGLSRDQIAALIKLDNESSTRPNQGAVQWAKLYLDDRAENVEAAARLGINSVLFDTVEKTTPRVESRFDIPVPSYGRRRQSSSQYSSTNLRPDRMASD